MITSISDTFNANVAYGLALTGTTTLLTGGALNLGVATTFSNTFTQSGGTLSNAAATVMNGAYNWSDGQVTGAGSLTTNGVTA